MDEARFQALARRARLLESDYGAGYLRGLRRAYHGERFGTADEHALWSRMGLDGDHRVELGRGYRDGLSGSDPAPARGRPPAAPGEARTERVEVRLTPAQRAKLDALGGADWLRRAIDRARIERRG